MATIKVVIIGIDQHNLTHESSLLSYASCTNTINIISPSSEKNKERIADNHICTPGSIIIANIDRLGYILRNRFAINSSVTAPFHRITVLWSGREYMVGGGKEHVR